MKEGVVAMARRDGNTKASQYLASTGDAHSHQAWGPLGLGLGEVSPNDSKPPFKLN